MDLTLIRVYVGPEGCFSVLAPAGKPPFAVALEHAYQDDGSMSWMPKLPAGVYTCARGQHQLEHGEPFITFEVMNVPGHTGILFHKGNVTDDSQGCILLGLQLGNVTGKPGILQSVSAFLFFMSRQSQVDQFQLTVE